MKLQNRMSEMSVIARGAKTDRRVKASRSDLARSLLIVRVFLNLLYWELKYIFYYQSEDICGKRGHFGFNVSFKGGCWMFFKKQCVDAKFDLSL